MAGVPPGRQGKAVGLAGWLEEDIPTYREEAFQNS